MAGFSGKGAVLKNGRVTKSVWFIEDRRFRVARDNRCNAVRGPSRVVGFVRKTRPVASILSLLLLFAFGFGMSIKNSRGRMDCSGRVIQFFTKFDWANLASV